MKDGRIAGGEKKGGWCLIGMGVGHWGARRLVTITDDVAQIHALFMPAGMEQMAWNMA